MSPEQPAFADDSPPAPECWLPKGLPSHSCFVLSGPKSPILKRVPRSRWRTVLALSLTAVAASFAAFSSCADSSARETADPATQTNVAQASHLIDEAGVPFLEIPDIGRRRHPAWIALYALAYAGLETYDPALPINRDMNAFFACISWLESNLTTVDQGFRVWIYDFDNTYNDISIKAPWWSAFAQATGIQAFLAAYQVTGDTKYIELARQATEALFVPIADGGLLFQRGEEVWFEEVPTPFDNPSHILNGHMRSLLALNSLFEATGDTDIDRFRKLGTSTLLSWLPRFDNGYWFRYDLNPRKAELLFRLANPFGYSGYSLAVDRISLQRQGDDGPVVLDIGVSGDSQGDYRIAGTDWGGPEELEGRSVRRLIPRTATRLSPTIEPPHSYFYLTLPGDWTNNLSDGWFELTIDYFDAEPANVSVQQRSASPGPAFRTLRYGDLFFEGNREWKTWTIPIRPQDLGFWVGMLYAEKHAEYLKQLTVLDDRFRPWADLALQYAQQAEPSTSGAVEVAPDIGELPVQTPPVSLFDLDSNGVIRQFAYFDDSVKPYHHPYIIADQAITAGLAVPANAEIRFDRSEIRSEPAINWLLDARKHRVVDDAILYTLPIDNAYNDVATKAPWPSSFFQAYALQAMATGIEDGLGDETDLRVALRKIAHGLNIPVDRGGVKSVDKAGKPWFEEVPNSTHVLNAHLASLTGLPKASPYEPLGEVDNLFEQGYRSLQTHLHLFDTGYWLRYDLNPLKQILLQIDWLTGIESPLIDAVRLYNPRSNTYTSLDVGAPGDIRGVSGLDWLSEQKVSERSVRAFQNGYAARTEPLQGGATHNVYLSMFIPDPGFDDYFDVPSHFLMIDYLDQAPGEFVLKIRDIQNGNQLSFTPLRGSVISMKGDRIWKTAIVEIRPQDMGWYKGPDYQVYEVNQLEQIANRTGDRLIEQMAQRQRYFLDAHKDGRSTIVERSNQSTLRPVILTVENSSPTYDGYSFENALDGDPHDDYVAGYESDHTAFVELKLEENRTVRWLHMEWENGENFARSVEVFSINSHDGSVTPIGSSTAGEEYPRWISLDPAPETQKILVRFSDFAGQNRLLLRLLEIQ